MMSSSVIDTCFAPSGPRALELNQRMHAELADSLAYLAEEITASLASTTNKPLLDGLAALTRDLKSGSTYSPALFASYYQLCMSLSDEGDQWERRLAQLLEHGVVSQGLKIRNLDLSGFGSMEALKLYQQALDTDDLLAIGFMPPDNQDSQETAQSINRALSLAERVAPALAAEFKALVHDIVLAQSPKTPGAVRFDGASSYQLWGALALSVEDPKSDLEMMETLAHESAHSFLFGMTIDEPLVKNPDDQLYASPLRVDLRPMDGIYHATYVSARMHYAMWQAYDSNVLNSSQIKECAGYLQASLKAFQNGWSVVEEHGDLSDTGAELMSHASDYMQSMSGRVSHL
ncbi:MAG: HEXXH motif-containing putative peptide modification protein [Pseudomonadales bacterium]